MRPDDTLVYVISLVGTPYVKVGKSCDMPQRISTMRTNNPFDMEVLYLLQPMPEVVGYEVRRGTSNKAEQRLHDTLKKFHFRDEWFSITDQAVLPCAVESLNKMEKAPSMKPRRERQKAMCRRSIINKPSERLKNLPLRQYRQQKPKSQKQINRVKLETYPTRDAFVLF